MARSPSAKSMTSAHHCEPRPSRRSGSWRHRPDSQPDGQRRIADRLDERHVFARQPRGFDQPTLEQASPSRPIVAMAIDDLSPAAAHRFCSSSNRCLRSVYEPANRWRTTVFAGRSASPVDPRPRQAVRRPAEPHGPNSPLPQRCHALRPRAARMCHPYAARRSPAASRCSAISAAFSSAEPRATRWHRPVGDAVRRDRL